MGLHAAGASLNVSEAVSDSCWGLTLVVGAEFIFSCPLPSSDLTPSRELSYCQLCGPHGMVEVGLVAHCCESGSVSGGRRDGLPVRRKQALSLVQRFLAANMSHLCLLLLSRAVFSLCHRRLNRLSLPRQPTGSSECVLCYYVSFVLLPCLLSRRVAGKR